MFKKFYSYKYIWTILVLLFILSAMFFGTQKSKAVPGFARQTGLACNSCHTVFPQLNSFGRNFKLNGYTFTTADVIELKSDDTLSNTSFLKLLKVPPLSAMLESSFTHLGKAAEGTANDNVAFPQQLSLFLAGAITPNLGIFLQITYDDQSGAFGWDNTEIRYADNTTIGETELSYGLTLNNNPTVQDLWNTTPAWGYPFASSSVAPTPGAATLVDGGLAGQSLGLGAFALWNNLIYGEFSVYRSAFQGGAHPFDATVSGVIQGVAPYWRLALQQQFTDNYISVGTFGLMANTIPEGISGTTNKFTDFGADLQYELNLGSDALSVYASYIHEKQELNATFASEGSQNKTNDLNQIKINASYFFLQRLNLTLGYFATSGTADNVLYPSGALNGNYGGKPDSDGLIAEFGYLPWLNTRFSLQYVFYNKFNGASANYDGFGRDAAHNNTIYFLTWFMF